MSCFSAGHRRSLALALVLVLAAPLAARTTTAAGQQAPSTPPAVGGGWQALLAGKHEEAARRMAQRLDRSPGDLRAAIGLAAIEEARGAADSAARHLLRAAESDRDGLLGAAALVRAMSLAADLRDGGEVARPVLERIVDGRLEVTHPELRSLAVLALADVLTRTGRPDESLEMLFERGGRIPTWSVLGPYGKFEGLAFSSAHPPESGDLDPSDDDLGPQARTPRRIDTRFADGRIVVPEAISGRGAFYAATDLVVDEPLEIRVRVSSGASVQVFLDGRLALTMDGMRQRPPLAGAFLARLQPGRHRLLVKWVTRPRSDPISLTVRRTGGKPAGAGWRAEHPRGTVSETAPVEPAPVALDDAAREAISSDDPASVVAATWWLRARNLQREMGETLRRAHERWPQAPLFELWLGEYFMKADTGAAPEEDLAAARGHIEDALAAADDLAQGHGLLAQIELGAQHPERAWEHVQAGLSRAPDQPDLLLLEQRIARDRGWNVEAAEAIERALRVAPGRSDVLQAAIDFYRGVDAAGRLGPLLEEDAARYPLAEQPPEWPLHQGRLVTAARAWRQLTETAPTRSMGWIGLVRTLVELGRYDDAREALDAARQPFPASGWVHRLRAGVLALQGADGARIRSELRAGLADDPGQLELRETLQRRGQPDRLSRWLVDPREILAQAEPPKQPMDSALLADIAVTLVDASGGQTELYQGVHKVYTRAGVEREGELEVLAGARIDRIRIHKADGRVVDVSPKGKRPISLPGLEPGDAFEYVWRRYTPPLREVPGALDNSTIFLFQGENRHYVLSRFVVVHDASLPVRACVNSEGLDFEETTEDGWRIRSWTAREMPRVQPEPHVADRFEATPHVRLGYGLRWSDVGNAIRNGLIGTLRPDPPLPTLAAQTRERAGSEDPLALARALHEVVNQRVEPGGRALRLGVPASVAASAGEGNRLGVALALAEQLGLEPALVLARPIGEADRDLDCPTVFGFPYGMLQLTLGGQEVYLDYNGADHAFDTIPLQVAGSTALRIPLDPSDPVELIDVPRREPPVLQEQRAKVSLDSAGQVAGELSITLRGPLASSTRRTLAEIPKDRMPQIEQGIAGQVFPGARVDDFSLTGRDDPEAPLQFDFSVEAGSLARRTPSGFAVPLAPRPLGLFEEFGALPSRRYAMLFSAQTLRRERVTVQLPEGLEAAAVPEPVSLDTGFGSYHLAAEVEGRTLTIERTVKLPPQRIEPGEYPRFRSMVRTIDQAERAEVRLEVDSPALAP